MERADFDQWKPKEVARLLALVETERRYYQEIVANVPVSLLIVGPDLKVLSSNRHFRAVAAKKNDEVLNQPLAELLPVEGAVALAQQVVRSGLPASPIEAGWPLNGKSIPVKVTALPLRSWEEDADAEALLVIQEAASAPVAEEPNRPKEIQSFALNTEVRAMLWEADLSTGRLTYVNPHAEALFGYAESEWLEKPELWTERVAPQDRERVRRFYSSVHESEATELTVEFHGVHSTGSPLVAREAIRIVRDAAGKPVRMIGCTTDVSQRREIEDQYASFLKGEALHRLSAKLAHDLNNLLMIVAGYGEELKNALPAANPLHNDMRQILEATERLYAVTTQLQSYTRRPVLMPRNVSVPVLLDAARASLERLLGPKIELRYDVQEKLGKAKVDEAQIGQVLSALAQHAHLELGGSGLVQVRAVNAAVSESTGRQGGLEAGDYVRLSFTHSGAPMSPESRERILEPWLYSEDVVRDVKMAMAAAYQIARLSGGDLRADGEGFHLYLPMISRAEREAERNQTVNAAAAIAPPVETAVAEPEAKLESIFVVEDEGGIRALVRKILKRQGYEVLEASHGEEALEVLRNHPGGIDLLLTDVMMPGMNGVELSYQAVAVRPEIRVLFVSGYTDESVLEGGQFPAGTAFLQKPFTLGSLLGKVREVLDAGAQHQTA
jgi:PAS domain S-box-containing protein